MGEERVGVLKESNQNEPVVDPVSLVLAKEHPELRHSNSPEVGDEVETEDLGEAFVVRPGDDYAEPDGNTDIRQDDLVVLVRCEHDRGWLEV